MRTVLLTALVLLMAVTAEGTCLDGAFGGRKYGCQRCTEVHPFPYYGEGRKVGRWTDGPTLFTCKSTESRAEMTGGVWTYAKCKECKQLAECEAECTPDWEAFIRAAELAVKLSSE